MKYFIFTLVLIISLSELKVEGFRKWQRAVDKWTNLILTITKTDDVDYTFFNNTLNKILIPRVSGTLGNSIVRQFITESMKSLGWKVDHDSFTSSTTKGTKTFTNIIATLNPSSCQRLILACHYDSKDISNFIGATDSAVPCSMIIYVAWSLNDYLQSFVNKSDKHTTLQLIFFDGEEAFQKWKDDDSLFGSRHLSDQWSSKIVDRQSTTLCPNKETELEKIELFILLDLIGTKDVHFCSMFWNTHNVYLQLSNIEKQLNKLNVLEKENQNEDTHYFNKECFLTRISDDYLPFLQKGVPVLHLIPPKFPKVWHKITDDKRHLHQPTINNLNKIIKLFVFTYLQKNANTRISRQ